MPVEFYGTSNTPVRYLDIHLNGVFVVFVVELGMDHPALFGLTEKRRACRLKDSCILHLFPVESPNRLFDDWHKRVALVTCLLITASSGVAVNAAPDELLR